jgi:hypothetical protein
MPIRSAVALTLAGVALLAGCGSSSNPADAEIRASYNRLLKALASNDAATTCELMLPMGQHQPRSALITVARRLSTPYAAAAYRRYVASCAHEVRSRSENFSAYYDGLRGSRLGTISIHGPIATVAVGSRTRTHGAATLTFVDAAGEWRLVIGIE